MIGKTVLHYRIVEKLSEVGRGGDKAEDTKLKTRGRHQISAAALCRHGEECECFKV